MMHTLRRLGVAMIVVAVAAGAAQADRPRVSGTLLPLYMAPGGPLALLRLLHGDGTSVRPVVLGANGEVYALGPHGNAAATSCFRSQCKVFLFSTVDLVPRVLVVAKSQFRYETAYRVANEDQIASAAAESAAEMFGFTPEPLSAALLVEAICAFIADAPLLTALLAAIALAVWPTRRLVLAARRAPTPSRRRHLGFAAAACGMATLALWVLALGGASFVVGFPWPVAMLVTVVAGAVVLAWTALAERRRIRTATT